MSQPVKTIGNSGVFSLYTCWHTFQVLRVTILSVDNSPPEVKVGSPVIVGEGGSTMIPSASIIASDVDTPLSDLKVVLDSQPSVGYLTNKNAGKS